MKRLCSISIYCCSWLCTSQSYRRMQRRAWV